VAAEASAPTQERIWSFFQKTRPRGLIARSTFSALSESAVQSSREELVSNEFSLFVDQHAQQAADLATELLEDARLDWQRFAGETDSAANESEALAVMVERAIDRCESLREINPELAEAVLMMFLTHQRSTQVYTIPPLAVRSPYKVLPSRSLAGAEADSAERFGSTPPEDMLDWFREDPLFNEHHEHWHIVYPFAGIRRQTRDRQGEMFLYMHQQMIARYDCERIAVGLPRVEPFNDFSRPMEGGYHPGPFIEVSCSYNAPRPPDLVIRDVNREMYGFPEPFIRTVSLQTENQRRLEEAVLTGYLRTPEGARLKLDPDSLGHTIEASNIDNVNAQYYGSFHNNGHRFIAAAHDPDGSKKQPLGVMARPETSFRDPIFFRWHKAIDDLSVTWQENQLSNDLSDAPRVQIRSGLDAQGGLWSPDIVLCERDRVEALREAGLTMTEIAQGAFGGPNWRNDYSAGEAAWGTKGAEHRLATVDTIRTFMASDRITYDGVDYEYDYLNHRPVTYFLRIENKHPEPRDVTVRIFLVPDGSENDRRMYIEMDKFRWQLDAREKRHNIVWRHDEQSAIIRKPAIVDPGAYNRSYDPSFGSWLPAPTGVYLAGAGAEDWPERRRRLLDYHDDALAFRRLRFGEDGDFDLIEAELRIARRGLEADASEANVTTFGALLDRYFEQLTDFNFDRSYCSCGYPYSLMFPRGTPVGMKFRLWVLVTDWEKDRVEETSRCASMSFCGAKDRYPDMRAMGYPFDRKFAEPIEVALGRLANAAGRRLTIRQEL
jgi:tyrosinase